MMPSIAAQTCARGILVKSIKDLLQPFSLSLSFQTVDGERLFQVRRQSRTFDLGQHFRDLTPSIINIFKRFKKLGVKRVGCHHAHRPENVDPHGTGRRGCRSARLGALFARTRAAFAVARLRRFVVSLSSEAAALVPCRSRLGRGLAVFRVVFRIGHDRWSPHGLRLAPRQSRLSTVQTFRSSGQIRFLCGVLRSLLRRRFPVRPARNHPYNAAAPQLDLTLKLGMVTIQTLKDTVTTRWIDQELVHLLPRRQLRQCLERQPRHVGRWHESALKRKS